MIQRVRQPPIAEPPPASGTRALKIISWNLLRLTGATLDDVARLIRRHHPDILLMQEATPAIDALAGRVGGSTGAPRCPVGSTGWRSGARCRCAIPRW